MGIRHGAVAGALFSSEGAGCSHPLVNLSSAELSLLPMQPGPVPRHLVSWWLCPGELGQRTQDGVEGRVEDSG